MTIPQITPAAQIMKLGTLVLRVFAMTFAHTWRWAPFALRGDFMGTVIANGIDLTELVKFLAAWVLGVQAGRGQVHMPRRRSGATDVFQLTKKAKSFVALPHQTDLGVSGGGKRDPGSVVRHLRIL